jgi:uncharacterized protein
MIDITRPIEHFLGFTALLRRAGFAIAPEQTIAWLTAIELLGPNGIDDIRRAAYATLAPWPERFAEFDALFDSHFLGAVVPGLNSERSKEAPPKAAEDSSIGPEPLFSDEARESGVRPSSAERLLARWFGPTDENEKLRAFVRALPAHLPRRRGYRWRSSRGGPGTDAHRMFRDAMRHAGEFLRVRRRQRRPRQRRVVVLIDVSGSMKERTHAHLAFAHALARGAHAVEVFTIGTRLTRITRPLRLRHRDHALAAASLLVADWDGGTRIGESLNAFLAVPRFAALARGAALVVLSDGLERGDPTAMGDAVARLARLSWRIIWLTPLAADPAFEPRTAGLAAARPHVDRLVDGSSIDSICANILDLANEKAA